MGAFEWFLVCVVLLALTKPLNAVVARLEERKRQQEILEGLLAAEKAAEAARRELKQALADEYGSIEVAESIISGEVWIGMTARQLVQGRGEPDAIEAKQTKKGRSYVVKYKAGARRGHGERFSIQDDVVTGWDIKKDRD